MTEDEIEELEEQISTLQSAVRSDPQTERLADEIFTILPDEKPGSHAWQEQLDTYRTELEAIEAGHFEGDSEETRKAYHGWKGTPEGLSEAFDESIRKIHVALDKAITETHLITPEESDGKTRYWKEV